MSFKTRSKDRKGSKVVEKTSKSVPSASQDAYVPIVYNVGSTTNSRAFYNPLYMKCIKFMATGETGSVAEAAFGNYAYPVITNVYARVTGNTANLTSSNITTAFNVIAQCLWCYYQLTHIMSLGKGSAGVNMTQHLTGYGALTRDAVNILGDVLTGFPCPRGLHELIYKLATVHNISTEYGSPSGILSCEPLRNASVTDANISAQVNSLRTSLLSLDRVTIQALRAVAKGDFWKIELKSVPTEVSFDSTWSNIWINTGMAYANAGVNNRSFVTNNTTDYPLINAYGSWSGLEDALMSVTVGANSTASALFQPGFIQPNIHLGDPNAGTLLGLDSSGLPTFQTVRNSSAIANSGSIDGHVGASGTMSLMALSFPGAQRVRWNVNDSADPVYNLMKELFDLDYLNSQESRF